MNSFLIWNQSPFLFTSDFISIRYYSVFFAVGLLLLLYRINKESTDDLSRDYVDKTFLNLLIYMLIGSRIFHCLFYEYGYYSENLLEIYRSCCKFDKQDPLKIAETQKIKL